MNREIIEPADLRLDSVKLWEKRWLLLCSGDYISGNYNAMTVAWGSVGVMWHKPFAQVVVRPGRYTYDFMERFPDFTLSVLPDDMRETMSLMGSKSGRNINKIEEAGLTVLPSEKADAPAFDEAELILECRKSYRQPFDPTCFLDEKIEVHYPQKDYHIVYYGEILHISGISSYKS